MQKKFKSLDLMEFNYKLSNCYNHEMKKFKLLQVTTYCSRNISGEMFPRSFSLKKMEFNTFGNMNFYFLKLNRYNLNASKVYFSLVFCCEGGRI